MNDDSFTVRLPQPDARAVDEAIRLEGMQREIGRIIEKAFTITPADRRAADARARAREEHVQARRKRR